MSNELTEVLPSYRLNDTSNNRSGKAFRQETIEVVTRLRSALLEAIGFNTRAVQKSRDVQKRFGVSLNLSWQVYRIATSADALECCTLIPTPAPMRKLILAIRKHGGVDEDISALEEAYAAFEQHVDLHAGDRARFDLMISQAGGTKSPTQVDLTHRRSVFDAYRHFTGVEIETILFTDILHPCDSFGHWDYVFMRLRNNLRRLNYNVPLMIDARVFLKSQDGTPASSIYPLDQEAFARYGIPILPAFCSSPDLPLRQVENPATGQTITEWMGDGVGKLSSVDVAFGEVHRMTSPIRRPGDRAGISTGTVIVNPVRTVIRDTLVHRKYFGRVQTDLSLWNHSMGKEISLDPLEKLGLPRLTCHDRVSFVGGGASAAYTPEVPKYVDMLRYACRSLGWQLEDFDVYRTRVEYPLIHTLQVCQFTFPDLPYLGAE